MKIDDTPLTSVAVEAVAMQILATGGLSLKLLCKPTSDASLTSLTCFRAAFGPTLNSTMNPIRNSPSSDSRASIPARRDGC